MIDSKNIKTTVLQDFYEASPFTDPFQKQPPEVLKVSQEDGGAGVFLIKL